MIQPKNETVIPLAAAPAYVPGRPHVSTVYRWIQRGSAGHRLESIRIGGRRFTSVEALDRFFRRVTESATGVCHGTEEQCQAADAAEAEADKLGL